MVMGPMTARTFFAITCGLLWLHGSSSVASASGDGILLLAHGGKAEWNERVHGVAAALEAEQPVEVAFGMATRSAIQSAVDRLTARGVSRVVAVPLFVSSHSSVVTSTEYLLGLRTDMPEDLKRFARMSHGAGASHEAHDAAPGNPAENLQPVRSTVPIVMTDALNAHPLVADILLSRAQAMSRAPEREAVILVAHGPVPDDDNARWLADMRSLAERMGSQASFGSIDYLTVRDDAPPAIRDQATAELRAVVTRRTGQGRRVLIVPLLLTYGGIEQGIRTRLEGLEYAMAEQALLPDDRIREWVRLSVASKHQPPK
jgi:sirohydrochlorin ferrochelatase